MGVNVKEFAISFTCHALPAQSIMDNLNGIKLRAGWHNCVPTGYFPFCQLAGISDIL